MFSDEIPTRILNGHLEIFASFIIKWHLMWKTRVGIKETENHEYHPTESIPEEYVFRCTLLQHGLKWYNAFTPLLNLAYMYLMRATYRRPGCLWLSWMSCGAPPSWTCPWCQWGRLFSSGSHSRRSTTAGIPLPLRNFPPDLSQRWLGRWGGRRREEEGGGEGEAVLTSTSVLTLTSS